MTAEPYPYATANNLIPPLNPLYRAIFESPESGEGRTQQERANSISTAGCVALAKRGKDAWNKWREDFPVRPTGERIYENNAYFAGYPFAEFEGDFSGFLFDSGTSFNGTTFEGNANFKNAIFNGEPDFADATFKQNANFKNATFKQDAYFTNTIFNGHTNFDKVIFEKRVFFQGAKLFSNTHFDGATFPKVAGDADGMRAYRTLKLAFSQEQATREEQFFFRKEMAEEAKSIALCKPRRWFFGIYWLLSNYGFSVILPLLFFIFCLFLFAWLYATHTTLCLTTPIVCKEWSNLFPALEFSLLQALPLPGLDKSTETLRTTLFGTSTGIDLTLLIITQKALSLLFLFLIGLALRNQFKMK